MENTQGSSPPHMDASRPSLGFPLGTALLLIIIFSLSGIFSCCYHWDKHRSLRRSLANASGHPSADIESSPFKPRPPFPVYSPLPFSEIIINYDFTKKKKGKTYLPQHFISISHGGFKSRMFERF